MPGLPVLSARSTKTHRHIDTRAKPVIKIFKKKTPPIHFQTSPGYHKAREKMPARKNKLIIKGKK